MGMAPHWGEFWEHRSLTAGERRLLLDGPLGVVDRIQVVDANRQPAAESSAQHRGGERSVRRDADHAEAFLEQDLDGCDGVVQPTG